MKKVVIPYEPTIRFAIKLYDEQNQAFGLLIINVDGYALFDTIKEYEVSNLEHKEIGILDHNNYWSFSNIVNDEIISKQWGRFIWIWLNAVN